MQFESASRFGQPTAYDSRAGDDLSRSQMSGRAGDLRELLGEVVEQHVAVDESAAIGASLPMIRAALPVLAIEAAAASDPSVASADGAGRTGRSG